MPTREVKVGERVISVHEAGAPEGPAILIHQGTPLAGPPMQRWADDAAARGARVITYDRPGYGGSTPARGRRVADAAADSAAIMDALGADRFVTWGISGGGPHVLACAALLGERVAAAACVAGVAPFDAKGLNYFRGMGEENSAEFGLALAGREHIEPVAKLEAEQMLTTSAAGMASSIETLLSPVDAEVLGGEIGEYWSGQLPNTFAQGVEGWVDDDLAFAAPFGFDVGEISVPTLVVHGRQDRFVPVDHGEWLAANIPGAEAWISDEHGHLTLMMGAVPDIHAWLLAHM